MVSDGGKNPDFFQDHLTWEFEREEDHLTVTEERGYFYGLKLSSITGKTN